MTDHPILFSPPMVRALIDCRKTQTRRIIELPAAAFDAVFSEDEGTWYIGDATTGKREHKLPVRYRKSDRLWVRETHYRYGHWQPIVGKKTKGGRQKWGFVATTDEVRFDPPAECRKGRHHKDPATPAWHKRLARFMPRWASRLTLTVTDVRVQRLQEISEADCIAEGPHEVLQMQSGWSSLDGPMIPDPVNRHVRMAPRTWYRGLWDTINGAGAWDKNPWVVALTFTVEKRNIDAIPLSYLIWSNEHGLWWRPNRAGYCADVSEAGRYSREEAIAQCATGRDGFTASRVPPELPVREIDAINQAGRSINDLVLKADRTECRMRDLASKARAA